jgi:hypothetical protein
MDIVIYVRENVFQGCDVVSRWMLTFGKNLQLKQDVGENGLDSCADNRDHLQAFVTLGMNFR